MTQVKNKFKAVKLSQDFVNNHTGGDWSDAVERSDRGATGSKINTIVSTPAAEILEKVGNADYDTGHEGNVPKTSWVVSVADLTYWQVPQGANANSPLPSATGTLKLKGRMVGDDDKPTEGGTIFSVTGVTL